LGAFSGSLTYTTFHVEGELETGFRELFLTEIQREVFRPLTVEEEREEAVGWVAIEHPFDVDLDIDKVFFNSYLNIALRIDRWRIPGPLFKAFFTDAERQHLTETGKEKLSRREKEELKAVVTATLRRQIIPAMRTIDLSWNLDTGVLKFWNQSERIHEVLDDIFETTFGLRLVQRTPYIIAAHAGFDEQQLDALSQLEPTPFHNKGNFIAEALAEATSEGQDERAATMDDEEEVG
jgi:recombination associated protein RdgC